jgi:hypothetical protein
MRPQIPLQSAKIDQVKNGKYSLEKSTQVPKIIVIMPYSNQFVSYPECPKELEP